MNTDFDKQFDRFTNNAKQSLENAGMIAHRLNSSYIGTEHLLFGVLKQSDSIGARILNQAGVTLDKLSANFTPSLIPHRTRIQGLSETAKKTIALSLRVAQEFGQPYAGTEHLLFAILSQKNARANTLLREIKVNPSAVRAELENYLYAHPYTYDEHKSEMNKKNNKYSKTPVLDHFGIDLNEKAKSRQLDPLIGRKAQINRMISILNRRTKNNIRF